MARDYKNIRAWKDAREFVLAIYQITKNFPREEIYGLTAQMRRAAVSVSSNIAEGATRQHKRDYLNFLYNAKGSLAEAESLLGIAKDLSYLQTKEFDLLDDLCQKAARSLYGLIKSVENEV